MNLKYFNEKVLVIFKKIEFFMKVIKT